MAQPSPVPVLAPPSRPARVAFPRGPGISASTSLVLGLAFFSFFVTCFFFLKDGALYWDNGQHFSQFRDNLHSLHAHGEIAWWFPHVQGGWPSYYYSILGFPHGASPVFAAVAAACWLAGRLGVGIPSYLAVYVVYFGLLTPAVFLFAVRAFVRRWLKDERAVVYALVLAAFSPGVVLNVSDIGFLEPAAYGLFFGTALLDLLRAPTPRHRWRLGLSLVALGLSLNFTFLFWNAAALPLFVALLALFAGRRRDALLGALRWPGARGWALLGALFLAGASPNLLAYAQGHDTLIKPHLEGVAYALEDLRPGNPLSPVAASVPGLGSKWAPGYRQNWALAEKESGQHIGYIYMGLLCVPLTIVGLTRGRAPVRRWIFAALLVVFGVVNLAAHSPLFAALLALPTPLRSNNHYSDLLHRGGGFLVLVMGAAFGLETLLRQGAATRRAALGVFLAATAVGLGVYVLLYEADTLLRASFGFSVLVAALTSVVLFQLTRARYHRAVRGASLALLAVALLDVSTQAFLHVRRVIHRGTGYQVLDEQPSPTGVGLAHRREDDGGGYYFVSNVLTLRSRVELERAGLAVRVPPARLFAAAHVMRDLRAEAERLAATGGFEASHSLALPPEDAGRPEAQPFLSAPAPSSPVAGRVEERARTYNQVTLHVSSSTRALLFLADSYSPYWSAQVDGHDVPVFRAWHHYKALPVPAGAAELTLRFSPPGIGASLLLAYGAFGLAAWQSCRRPRRARSRAHT